ERVVGWAEAEAEAGRGPAARGFHVRGEPVLGAQVGHLARDRRAEPPRPGTVAQQRVDVVVDDGGDADVIDFLEPDRGHGGIIPGSPGPVDAWRGRAASSMLVSHDGP